MPQVQSVLLAIVLFSSYAAQVDAQEASELTDRTGPTTEERFPRLKVPEGFKATLFACDPLVEYPSVITLGPRHGTLFVAHDYVTGLGVEIVRRDEIRLIEDTDGDGYADKLTVYAKGFNSIQGLAFDDGNVFAMHAPFLTRLRDTDGDGVADQRRDLINGLGLPPEENSNRLHCANGVVAGHDGWLYLALGDRGCDVKRPEGDRLLFQQGGILRCRADGTGSHVFSTGLRNIYDVALDEELNVFVRDNENDGGDYMIRVCHCFHGSDHGYPYHYYERPDEAMPPLADLGRGSSAGGACYLETSLPAEYRGNLFFCEWGRSVVRYAKDRQASSFAPMKEVDFAYGDPEDPYGFKPTDLIVDRDGSILVSDWADGQRPKRGRGRIYRIEYVDGKADAASADSKKESLADWIEQLSSPSHHVRVEAQRAVEREGQAGWTALREAIRQGKVQEVGRLHAVWVVSHVQEAAAIGELFALIKADGSPRVQAQAIRAIADLADPILAKHQLAAKDGDAKVAQRLAELNIQRDPRVMLEVVIALGRLRWPDATSWLHRQIKRKPDEAVMHAALQAIRRAANWDDALAILDDPFAPVRPAALRAAAELHEVDIVDGLLDRLKSEQPLRRREYADLLSRVYKKPEPWQYWGFRPAPRPVNSVAWERTNEIEKALVGLLADAEFDVRAFIASRMLREQIPIPRAALAVWLDQETAAERVDVILTALEKRPADESLPLLESVLRSDSRADENRSRALKMIVKSLDPASSERLLKIASALEDGAVMAQVLDELGRRPKLPADPLLVAKVGSAAAEVRAAAIAALANRGALEAAKRVPKLLADKDVRVRRAAAFAAGDLKAREAATLLLTLASDNDAETRRACLQSLRALKIDGAVDAAVAALHDPETQLAGLAYLRDFGDPTHANALHELAATNRSHEVLLGVIQALSALMARTREPHISIGLEGNIATVQGNSGALLRWNSVKGGIRFTKGVDGQVSLAKATDLKDAVWRASTTVFSRRESAVEFLAASSGTLEVMLNGESVFRRDKVVAYRADQDRFVATLPALESTIEVRVTQSAENPRFQLRFRHKSSRAEHERLATLLLSSRGNVTRGREVFLNTEKAQCVKCHRMGDVGGRVGPDLTGIGRRFSRVHLIEAILEPSRTIAPSYNTHSLITADGRVLSGIKISEDDESITLGDNEGKMHVIRKSDIEESKVQPTSTMPEGLERHLTDRELMDLLAFLLSETKQQSQ